ncbi:MAG: N-acetylmuramoyl-L-alanine amidase [Lachnospiraceae bacterium]|nr:N-acetylmuramoyl-L-alanine amidase [Lachnospiraceae bacterium]
MYQRFFKQIAIVSIMSLMLMLNVTVVYAAKENDNIIICLDPGHGGETDGAIYTYYDVLVKEKDLNLSIALKLKEELEKYENVQVVMTRTEDVTMEINPRAEYALGQNADYLISVHNNAAGGDDRTKNGCMVLSSVSHYQPQNQKNTDIHGVSEKLSLSIVEKLNELGIPLATELGAEVNGVVKRPYSPEGQASTTRYYPDGSVTDYYGLIRGGVKAGIPTIIIEHAYVSSEQDYRNYLSSEEALAALAEADAQGIAQALGLVRKTSAEPEKELAGLLQKDLQILPWNTIER